MDSANGTTAVEEQRLTERSMHRGPYLGDISALCFLRIPNLSLPFLLAGNNVLLSPFSSFNCTVFVILHLF